LASYTHLGLGLHFTQALPIRCFSSTSSQRRERGKERLKSVLAELRHLQKWVSRNRLRGTLPFLGFMLLSVYGLTQILSTRYQNPADAAKGSPYALIALTRPKSNTLKTLDLEQELKKISEKYDLTNYDFKRVPRPPSN